MDKVAKIDEKGVVSQDPEESSGEEEDNQDDESLTKL